MTPDQSDPQQSRRDRRARDRQDRFEAARAERRRSSGATAARRGGLRIDTTTMTIAGLVVGIAIVVVVAAGQLGGGETLRDPGISYPEELLDGKAIGRADAPVLVEVYEDFQCPFCAQYSLDVEPGLVARFVTNGSVRIEHRDIAILDRTADAESTRAAAGAFCADRQDAYWAYASWAYANQDGENRGGFSAERLTRIAEAAGLDLPAWSACLASAEALAEPASSTREARERGVDGTPTLFIDGERAVFRSFEEVEDLVQAAVDAAG